MFLKLHLRVPPCIRSDQIFNALIKSSPFSVCHRASVVGNAVRDCTRRGQRRGALAIGRSSEVSDVTDMTYGRGTAAVSRGRIRGRCEVQYLA